MYSFIEILYISWTKGEQKNSIHFTQMKSWVRAQREDVWCWTALRGTSTDQGMFMGKFCGDLVAAGWEFPQKVVRRTGILQRQNHFKF